MVQFKELILLIAVTTSLSSLSCSGNKIVMKKEDKVEKPTGSTKIQSSDTLFLSLSDYKILLSNKDILDIEITNEEVAGMIKSVKYSVIKFEFERRNRIAKSNNLFSSFVPKDCDYFYPSDKGYVVFINNKISFRKTPTATP